MRARSAAPDQAGPAELDSLVRRYGSPLYVYRLDSARRAHADLRSALPEPSVLYYSVKANPHPLLVSALAAAGCRAETSSRGELDTALDRGFSPADCLYTGPGKTDDEIHHALSAGVRRFSAESAAELHRLGSAARALGTEAFVLLRVNGTAAGTTGLRMTGAASQFGVDEARVRAAPGEFLAVPGARLVGVHLYPLSNARDEASLIAAFRSSIALAARLRDDLGFPMGVVDLGGGFAAPYGGPGARPTYPALRQALEEDLDARFPGWRAGRVEVAFESGRYLVGDSGLLAVTVRDVKTSRGQVFVVVDAGINHLGGMSGLGRLARAGITPEPAGAPTTTASLVGPLCTPADVLGRGVAVPEVGVGGLLSIPNVGAYGLSASLLAFLSRPVPAEVVVDGGAVVAATRARLIHESLPVADGEAGEA
ncbi:type III PLP-dependent enzyme [Actinoalloteichus caeruleus]|uniref:type III PLP-dependent enzyme n=1 Tax=Actinoalloteichus cyanogriseus TaxID=2893586 RepID=UPI003AAE8089